MIFKIENEDDKYPDADKLPKVTLMDERIWKDQVDQNQVDWKEGFNIIFQLKS